MCDMEALDHEVEVSKLEAEIERLQRVLAGVSYALVDDKWCWCQLGYNEDEHDGPCWAARRALYGEEE